MMLSPVEIHDHPSLVLEGVTDFRAIAAAPRTVNFTDDAMIELAHEKDFKPTRPLA